VPITVVRKTRTKEINNKEGKRERPPLSPCVTQGKRNNHGALPQFASASRTEGESPGGARDAFPSTENGVRKREKKNPFPTNLEKIQKRRCDNFLEQ